VPRVPLEQHPHGDGLEAGIAWIKTDRAMAAAPFLFVLLWSLSFITAKTGLRHLSPLRFVAIRLVACAVVLMVLMILLRQSWRSLAGWKWLQRLPALC
jgi:drug/metabolite transporter (DMT)-like permease